MLKAQVLQMGKIRKALSIKIKGDRIMKFTLKGARVNVGLTQTEVAKEIGVNKGTLVNYEKYRTIPDVETAKKLAKLYGLSVNDLIFLPSDCA